MGQKQGGVARQSFIDYCARQIKQRVNNSASHTGEQLSRLAYKDAHAQILNKMNTVIEIKQGQTVAMFLKGPSLKWS